MAQALWNGFLRVSLVSCPVSLAPAAIAGKRIRLDEVNAGTGNPVTEQFVDAKTGNVVPSSALAKAYRVDEGKYVIVSADELQGVASSPANILDIEQFVRKGQVDRVYFEAVCYVHPEGELAADTVQALRLAMERNGRVGIGRVSLGGRERAVMVEPHGAGLMLTTLHSPDEIEPPAFAERAADRIPGEMVEVAETIIGRRSRDFAPDLLTDRADAALRALIEKKTGGAGAPPAAKPAPKPASEPPKPAPVAAPASPATVAPTPPPAPEPPKPAPPAPAPVAAPAPPPASGPAPAPPPPPPAPALIVAPAPPSRPTLAVVPPSEPAPDREPASLPQPEAAAEASPAAAGPPAPEPARVPPAASAPSLATLDPGEDTVAAGTGNGADVAEKPVLAEGSPRELGAEVLLHIMGLGDRRYVEMGWAGNPGSRRQIEALSIRPREVLPASAVEFRVFAQEGRATAWVSNGNYAGTRGRGLPLTGFAVRPAPNLSDRLEIVYEGSFFEAGTVGPKRDGELCVSPVADDPLEAVRVSIVERAPD